MNHHFWLSLRLNNIIAGQKTDRAKKTFNIKLKNLPTCNILVFVFTINKFEKEFHSILDSFACIETSLVILLAWELVVN